MSQDEKTADPLLAVENLQVHFGSGKNPVRAVDGVNLTVGRGETLGLVGESGCGKTTTGMAIMNLLSPTEGSIRFEGQEISALDKLPRAQQLHLRSEIQVVFQDPYSSLNPRMTLRQALDEPMKIHGVDRQERGARIDMLLDRVGLNAKHADRYPHEFSGGQRQRIGIARALALKPKLIICDEAVSALDVSIQAQIVNLLIDLQKEFGLSYLFISHDLAVVEHIADRIAVMYLGKIVETAPYDRIFANPQHPYTQALLSAIPVPDPDQDRSKKIKIEGELPSPFAPPPGCRFHPRCAIAQPICGQNEPLLLQTEAKHDVACHLVEKQR